MTTNAVLSKDIAAAALTITLASLASSTAGVGRQSTMVDNTSTKYTRIKLYFKITQGTSPTGNKAVYCYAIKGDKHATAYRSDGAGASDAAFTINPDMLPIRVLANKSSPSTGDVLFGEAILYDPGPEWGIGVYHDTGVALDSTAGNHFMHWVGDYDDIQAAA